MFSVNKIIVKNLYVLYVFVGQIVGSVRLCCIFIVVLQFHKIKLISCAIVNRVILLSQLL